MRKQLSDYLWVAVFLQLFFAASVDWLGHLAAIVYQVNGMKLFVATSFCISIGHWAFIWPVVVTFFALWLSRSNRTDSFFLHSVCAIFSASLVMMVADVTVLFFPFTQVLRSLSGGD